MAADVGQDGYAVDEAMEDHYQAEQESSRPVVGEEASKPRGPPRKRRRIVISCTECHRRKQKCDRNLPCANCVSRHKEDLCRYDSSAPTAKEHSARRSSERSEDGPEDGSLRRRMREENFVPAKVVNFGYSSTGASTLGFLRKIDSAAQDAEGGSEANRQLNGSSTLSGRGPEHGEAGPGTGEGTGNGDGAVGGGAPSLSALSVDGQAEAAAVASNNAGVRERYKSLVRQLPPRVFVERLVDIFFRDFNWQYYTVDEDVFRDQLARWNAVPFSVLSASGPMALSPDMRAFPALLFQVVATALLVLPDDEPDETFDTLKYGDMTFEDLALDYSESGMAVLSLLGKRHMSLTTVLAGFARAAFLKYTGMVTEAWHAIGSAIRDGQEIGLHRDSMDPRPASSDVGDVLENQWLIQRRRRLWVTLVGWDLHTGVILGRPLTIDSRPDREPAVFTMPVDAPIPRDRRSTPVVARNELDDPPTPLTRALWAYRCMAPLRDILDLERDGPCPKDFSKVDEMERRLRELQDQTPPYFRLENPDERFDSLPECYWLPYVRANLPQLIQFNFMALHRPYIFTRKRSRTEALKASLEMLQVQRMHFLSLKPNHFKIFTLFFGSFDAIVLMSSIFILFPREHRELVPAAMQHFVWAVERFEAMQQRNSLAKAALSVLKAIYIRLKKALGLLNPGGGGVHPGQCRLASACPMGLDGADAVLAAAGLTTTAATAPSTAATGSEDKPAALEDTDNNGSAASCVSGRVPPDSGLGSSVSGTSPSSVATTTTSWQQHQHQRQRQHQHQHQQRQANYDPEQPEDDAKTSSLHLETQGDEQQQSTTASGENDWGTLLPQDFDFASIMPTFPMGDLVYNDLAGVSLAGDGSALAAAQQQQSLSGLADGWLLDGGQQQPPHQATDQQQQQQQLWQFEGDFSDDSIWNLLNQYAPY